MTKVAIHFDHILQDSQDLGSDDDHMISRVFFAITVGDESFANLYADIKQTVGADFATDPLEVSQPANYTGPLDFNAFRKCVEEYYRKFVGAQGSGVRVAPKAGVRMRNNNFGGAWSCSFDASETTTAW